MQTPIGGEKVETLYSELRECIRTKNQDQARRVRRELVRAGRPLSEILGQATNILATIEKSNPRDGASQQGILHQSVQNTLDLTSQNPDRLAGSIYFGKDREIAVVPLPNHEEIGPPQRMSGLPKDARSTPLASAQNSDRLSSTCVPHGRDCATAIVDGTEAPPTTEVEPYSNPHIGGQLATRPFPVRYLGIAFSIVLAMASVGLFLLMRPTEEKIAITSPAHGSLIALEGFASPGAFMTGEQAAAVVASSTPTEAAPDSSGTNLVPAPREPLTEVAMTVPDRPSAVKSDAKPLTADVGLPGYPVPSVSAEASGLAPPVDPLATTSVVERASDPDAATLLERGDSLFRIGDVASARLFYERAIDAENGEAALRLGVTYDPDFLAHTHLGVLHGDITVAVYWYRRAGALGAKEAQFLLQAIERKNER